MPASLALVTRQLADQLKEAFSTGHEPRLLESAICAFVGYFRERDVPAKQIVDTACVLIDRAKSDRPTAGAGTTPAQVELLATEIIDRCLFNCMRLEP